MYGICFSGWSENNETRENDANYPTHLTRSICSVTWEALNERNKNAASKSKRSNNTKSGIKLDSPIFVRLVMLICLGGVCVPYTAVVPIVILALKWIVDKLGLARFFPKFLRDALQLASVPSDKDCCTTAQSASEQSAGSLVKALKSDEEFEELLKDESLRVVCKFTSSWCQPCKKIQPFFEHLSTQYKEGVEFRTIDVDEFDDIATKYKVAMMPTFLVLEGGRIVGTYSGSNTNELQSFLEENVGGKE
eukprot:scaffold2299_cov131-Cylindrotheca_fusiformis.AAC.33